MDFDDSTGFEVHDEYRAYENSQPTGVVEGGVWCSHSKKNIAKLKQNFHDVIEVSIETELSRFFDLLNDLRDLYCTDEKQLKDESLESNDIYWVKAAIGFMEILLHVRNDIAEIQHGIIPTKLSH